MSHTPAKGRLGACPGDTPAEATRNWPPLLLWTTAGIPQLPPLGPSPAQKSPRGQGLWPQCPAEQAELVPGVLDCWLCWVTGAGSLRFGDQHCPALGLPPYGVTCPQPSASRPSPRKRPHGHMGLREEYGDGWPGARVAGTHTPSFSGPGASPEVQGCIDSPP